MSKFRDLFELYTREGIQKLLGVDPSKCCLAKDIHLGDACFWQTNEATPRYWLNRSCGDALLLLHEQEDRLYMLDRLLKHHPGIPEHVRNMLRAAILEGSSV